MVSYYLYFFFFSFLLYFLKTFLHFFVHLIVYLFFFIFIFIFSKTCQHTEAIIILLSVQVSNHTRKDHFDIIFTQLTIKAQQCQSKETLHSLQ